jgi:hypothetical protein
LANLAAGTNLILCTVGLLPIPYIDGGPVLKWSLVERGHTVEEAERTVQKVNGPLALITGLLAVFAFQRRKRLIGIALSALSISSLGIFMGWLREDKLPW